MPKPIKHKKSRGNVQYDGSQQHQARNGQAAREVGTMFLSSGRNSPSSTRTYHSGPSTVSHRRVNGTSQRRRVEEVRPPKPVVLVNSAPLPRSQHGTVLSRPGGSSAPSIQRHATVASSHRSRSRRHGHPVEEVSPLSSVVELNHLNPHPPRSPSPLSSYGGRGIPDITITPCGSNRSSVISQANHHGYPAHQSDRESFTSQNTFHTAFWDGPYGPIGYDEDYVPSTPQLIARANRR